MKTNIMVAAIVCLSIGAGAQQSSSGQTKTAATTAVAAPSGAANGKVTGKKGYDYYKGKSDGQAAVATGSNDANAGQATVVRESPTKASTKLRESPTKSNMSVSVGDVNGDGKADKAATSQSNPSGQNAAINNSHSNIKSPRDVATGQSSGKRQYQPVSVSKESDAAPEKR
jgi:hypothetical protein